MKITYGIAKDLLNIRRVDSDPAQNSSREHWSIPLGDPTGRSHWAIPLGAEGAPVGAD